MPQTVYSWREFQLFQAAPLPAEAGCWCSPEEGLCKKGSGFRFLGFRATGFHLKGLGVSGLDLHRCFRVVGAFFYGSRRADAASLELLVQRVRGRALSGSFRIRNQRIRVQSQSGTESQAIKQRKDKAAGFLPLLPPRYFSMTHDIRTNMGRVQKPAIASEGQ